MSTRYMECPECEGAVMNGYDELRDICPRCGYVNWLRKIGVKRKKDAPPHDSES